MFVLGLVTYNKLKNILEGVKPDSCATVAFGVPQTCGTGGSVITLFLLSMYVCGVHVQVSVCLWACPCVSACSCGGQRLILDVFSNLFFFFFLRQWFSMNRELTILARLARLDLFMSP